MILPKTRLLRHISLRMLLDYGDFSDAINMNAMSSDLVGKCLSLFLPDYSLDDQFFVSIFFLTIVIEETFPDFRILDFREKLRPTHIKAFPAYEYTIRIEQIVHILSRAVPRFIGHHKETPFIIDKERR